MRFGLLLSCCTLFLAGCGDAQSGPERFRVHGKVVFNGQPVKAGMITFQPASGPSGSAQIKDGVYDTNDGKGVVGGPHKIIIEGYDGSGAAGEMGKPIFKPQTLEEDLPKADTEKSFEIPASAAEGLIISNDPA